VATDVLGVSGRAMLRAMIDGVEDPEALAEHARGSLRGKKGELASALRGFVGEHHRFQLRMLLEQVEQLGRWVDEFDRRIEQVMDRFELDEPAGRVEAVPGVGRRASEVIIAEIGPDMAAFPTAGHLASWAGMCSGNDQSAGKRRTGKTTKGSRWLRAVLVQVAWSASHTKETIFSATYRRWVKRLGKKKALVALGHKILTVIDRLLKDGVEYQERWQPTQPA
jgi:transposase